MLEIINAVNGLSWPGAFAIGCMFLAIGLIGYAMFR